MAEDNRKTVIQSFQSEPQAHITQLHLVAMGIEAWTEKDDGGGAYPPLQFSNGVHVVVLAGDAEKARGILRSVEEEAAEETAKEKPVAATRVRAKSWRVFLVGLLAGGGDHSGRHGLSPAPGGQRHHGSCIRQQR